MAKSSSTETDTGPDHRPRGNLLTRLLFRPRLLLVLALLVFGYWLGPRLAEWMPPLQDRPEYRLRPGDIRISRPPRWVPRDLVDQVLRRAGWPEETSLLETDLPEKLAEAFRLHPWVAEVKEVRKLVPHEVKVELRYRRPVAFIDLKRGMYPVDADGILLPPEDFAISDTRRYPVIQGVQSTPEGPAGTEWGDPLVSAAARLADVLAPHWDQFGLKAIHTPRHENETVKNENLTFELTTDEGSRIIWGRPPGTDHPGTLSAEQKIGRLRQYRRDFGGFAMPHGPYEIDIRHWQEISRRPLTAGRPRREDRQSAIPNRREIR